MSGLRIGLDALTASAQRGPRRSGIHRYADELIRHLPHVVEDATFVVFADPAAIANAHPHVQVHAPDWRVERPMARALWEAGPLSWQARRHRLDLLHGMAFTAALAPGTRQVVTVHDLAFWRWPELVPRGRYHYLRQALRIAARRAARIIAVSQATKDDVIELLGFPAERIDVTPLGVSPLLRAPGEEAIAAFRAQRGGRPFILAVGNLEPRKNLPALVEAFGQLSPSIPHDLVLIGAAGWKTAGLAAALAASPARERIETVGYVESEALPIWYASCDLFVMPSRYEGFGLPLVEAMACGAPCLTTPAGALSEVGGDAVAYAEPTPDALADGISRLLADDDTRQRLGQRGRDRARIFRWERTARLTYESYQRALSG